MYRNRSFLPFLIVMVFPLMTPCVQAALTNGNFEYASTTGWATGAGTYLITAGNRPGGSGMFYLQMVGIGGGTTISQAEFALQQGETWRVTGWIRNDTGSANMNFGWYTSSLNPIATVSVTSTSWR
ncbi:MAG TPA: hypothetical protein PKH07_06195, partial [bacterium]|nr:hypothetical protein [bacterium]